LGETRPAWKVLRVLANLLGIPGFDFETSQDVLVRATNSPAGTFTHVSAEQLSNVCSVTTAQASGPVGEPAVASIYQLDGLVRRSTSLQLTADARMAREGVAA
jgi:NADH-quinone oxidoreductase subunit G